MTIAFLEPRGSDAHAGLKYWQELRRDREMPARADIDPLDIPELLPLVFLVNVLHEPLDFQYRLLGTEIVRHSAGNYTGYSLRDLPEQCPPSRIWTLYERVVTERRPLCSRVPYVHTAGKFVEMMAAPLSDAGARINKLFGIVQFEAGLMAPGSIVPRRDEIAF